jgi:DNA-binding Xre family transcriptional regulator
MKTLPERLTWVLKHRGMSASALSLKAGLARTHVGLILSGRSQHVREGTLEKLCAAADVSSRWLASGQGPREPYEAAAPAPALPSRPAAAVASSTGRAIERTVTVYEDAYPSRGVVLALLRGKLDANILAALASIRLESDRDPGEGYWLSEVKRLKRQLEQLERDHVIDPGWSSEREVQPEPGDRMPP